MSDDKPAKRRKIPVKVKSGTVMASQTTSVTDGGNKDSPVGLMAPGSAGPQPFQTIPAFPNPVSIAPTFGAPTYINRPSNPWQHEYGDKLDIILSKLSKIEVNQNTFLTRLDAMEGKLVETNKKVIDIENSQSFISTKHDDLDSRTKTNKNDVKKLQGEVKTLQQVNDELTVSYKKIKQEVTDLKCRSMRDNMLFFGIRESQSLPYSGPGAPGFATQSTQDTAMEASGGAFGDDATFQQSGTSTASFANVTKEGENCFELVYEFCEKLLKIDDPKSKIKIERAHRIGARKPDKIRPIVAKFVLSEHKDVVKTAAGKVDLKAPPYNGAYRVTDQLPPEVLERRKELIPRLISERAAGNKASLVRDKLYVNGKFVE